MLLGIQSEGGGTALENGSGGFASTNHFLGLVQIWVDDLVILKLNSVTGT